jgi:hypothetical protein
MPLDEWQQIALEVMLGVAEDGSWSAQEFGLVAARQNGKSAILEARELAGLFLFGEPRIIHSRTMRIRRRKPSTGCGT